MIKDEFIEEARIITDALQSLFIEKGFRGHSCAVSMLYLAMTQFQVNHWKDRKSFLNLMGEVWDEIEQMLVDINKKSAE